MIRLLGERADGGLFQSNMRLRHGDSGPCAFLDYRNARPRLGTLRVDQGARRRRRCRLAIQAESVRPFVQRYLDFGVFESLRG